MIIDHAGKIFNLEEKGEFEDGSPRLFLIDHDNLEPYARLTFCAHDGTNLFPAAEGCFWLKDWSENEEVVADLIAQGIFEYTGDEIPREFVTYKQARFKKKPVSL